MSDSHRVLFCIGVNQNFMDATQEVMGHVWVAFQALLKGINDIEGAAVLGVLDDDQIQVGPSQTAPWTAYIMADMPDFDAVVAGCDLLRSIPVGDGTYKLWKFMRIEVRIGRALDVPD